jgi:hypothetical protein
LAAGLNDLLAVRSSTTGGSSVASSSSSSTFVAEGVEIIGVSTARGGLSLLFLFFFSASSLAVFAASTWVAAFVVDYFLSLPLFYA